MSETVRMAETPRSAEKVPRQILNSRAVERLCSRVAYAYWVTYWAINTWWTEGGPVSGSDQ